MRRRRAVFFDAGFTLIDPVRSVNETYFDHACRFDPTLDAEKFKSHFRACWSRLNRDFRSRDPELLTSEEMERAAWHGFTRWVAEPFPGLLSHHEAWLANLVTEFDQSSAWKVLPGAETLLHELRERGYGVGVVSNWHRTLHGILQGLGLGQSIDTVLTSSELGRKKPHRFMFLTACERLGVAPADALHVGDSWEEDVLGAMEAGIRAIYFARNEPCLETGPSVPVIRSLDEVSRLID